MPKVSDLLAERHKPNILGYGPSMCGKTRFITTLRKVYKGPCYIFNFDPQDNLTPIILAPGMGDVEYDQYDVSNGYDLLVRKIIELRKASAEASREGGKPFPYDLICVENVNVMHKTTIETLLTLAGRADTDGARIQDWGLAADRVKKRLKEIVDLPCPIYVTAHQQLEKDEIYGRTVGRILIPGKFLPDEIPPMFNLFLHFITTTKSGGVPEYKIQCASDPLWPAGDKTASLEAFEEPDFVKMAVKFGNKLTAARAAAASAPTTTTKEKS
jgi:hypothetical protein